MDTSKILSVLRAEVDGLIDGTMAKVIPDCGRIGHCALGALLADAGVTDARLEDWADLRLWSPLLGHVYGLSHDQCAALMHFSDTCVGFNEWLEPSRPERLDRLNTVMVYIEEELEAVDQREGIAALLPASGAIG